jgi:hypothetical protein
MKYATLLLSLPILLGGVADAQAGDHLFFRCPGKLRIVWAMPAEGAFPDNFERYTAPWKQWYDRKPLSKADIQVKKIQTSEQFAGYILRYKGQTCVEFNIEADPSEQ